MYLFNNGGLERMKLPFWNKQKSEQEKELEQLEQERKLGEAKLRAAEVSPEVIIATKVNSLFQTLRKGCHNEDEFDRRLRHYAEQSDIDVEYLRQEFSFKDGVRRLESLNDTHIAKLEKLANMDRDRKRMLGWTK